MKAMAALILAVLLPVTLIGGAHATDAADSSSIRVGSAGASSLESAASAIARELENFEDTNHHELQRWCNTTINAQTSRRSALVKLLQQSQSVQLTAPGSLAKNGDAIQAMEQEAAGLGSSLEEQRLSTQAALSAEKQRIAALQLSADDASKDVEALQRVWEHLGGASGSGQGAAAKVVAKLLLQAKKTLEEREAKAAWVQAGERVVTSENMSKLEVQYRAKKAAIMSFEHQYYATQRSLDVLTSALEDESGYLSDLEGICNAEKHVHDRIESRVLPELRSVPKLVAASPVVHEEAPAVVEETPASVAVATTTAAPMTTLAASTAAPVTTTEAPPAPTTTVPALPVKKTVAKAKAQPAAYPAHKTTKKVVAVKAATKATAKTHGKTTKKALKHAAKVTKVAAKVAKAPAKASVKVPAKAATKAHKKKQAPATTTTVDPLDAFADSDDEVTPPPPKKKPTKKAATKLAAKVGAKKAAKKDAKHAAAKKVAPKPVPTTTQDPLDAAADNFDDSEPTTPAPKKKAHKGASLAQEPPKHKAKGGHVTTTAGVDLDADLSADDDAPTEPPAPAVKKAAHSKKATKKDSEGLADSDAGGMPSAYTAWKPDDSSLDDVPTTTADPSKPTKAPTSAMKDMLDSDKSSAGGSDDDFDKDMKNFENMDAGPTKPVAKKASKKKKKAPAASTTADDASSLDASSLDGDDSTAAPVTPPKKHKKQKHTTAAPSSDASLDSDGAGPDSADMSLDGGDAVPTPAPSHKNKKLRGQKKKEDAPADDDKDFDKDMSMLDTSSSDAKSSSKKEVTTTAASDDIPTPTPEMDSDMVPAPKKKSNKLRGGAKKQDNFMDGVYNAAAGNLPSAYSAWSPDKSDPTPSPKSDDLKAMEADFDKDDDADSAPKKKHKKHHHHHSDDDDLDSAPSPPPAPKVMKGDDGVTYDDDDLPKHHKSSFEGLQGGWQSFMKKGKKTGKKPKLDPDVAIMESLYTKDGGLPSQYTAWTPDSGAEKKATGGGGKKAKMFDDNDLAAAAKEFEKEGDSFLQVSSESAHESVAGLIHSASAPMAVNALSGTPLPTDFASLLEVTSSSNDQSGVIAAGVVLDEYAEVLQSQPLQQLSKAHLSPSKLGDLFRQLRDVDPLTHAASKAPHGKQAQAEQWCLYFQQHVQSAAPMQQAVARVEAASNQLARAASQRAAMLEEVAARKQLHRTMERDIQSLQDLSRGLQQGQDSSKIQLLQKHLASRGGGAAAAVAAAAEDSHNGNEELLDFIEMALQKRTTVLKVQAQKMAELQVALKSIEKDVSDKRAEASNAQASIETARTKLSGIQSSCDAALSSMEKRRHDGHMEAHAIEVALRVLGNQ